MRRRGLLCELRSNVCVEGLTNQCVFGYYWLYVKTVAGAAFHGAIKIPLDPPLLKGEELLPFVVKVPHCCIYIREVGMYSYAIQRWGGI